MTRFRATSTRFLSEKQRTEKTLRPTTPMSSFISISFFSIVELPTNCNLPNERRSGSRSVTDSDVNRESFSLSTDAQHPLRFLITRYPLSIIVFTYQGAEVAVRNERRKGSRSLQLSIRQYPPFDIFLAHALRIPSSLRAHRRLRGDQLGYTLFTSARSRLD